MPTDLLAPDALVAALSHADGDPLSVLLAPSPGPAAARRTPLRAIAVKQAVPEADARAALEAAITDSGIRLARYTERYLAGALGPLEWRLAMQREMAIGHRLAVVLARGGVEHMGPPDWIAANQAAVTQYRWFTQWAAARGSPTYDRSVLQEMARARLYAGQYHTTYESIRRRDAQAAGDMQERNVLTPTAESCEQCRALSARGWVAIGTLPVPGTRQCLSNCRCRLETRPIPQETPPSLEQREQPPTATVSGAETRDALLAAAARDAALIDRWTEQADTAFQRACALTQRINSVIDQMDPLDRDSPEWERLDAEMHALQEQRRPLFTTQERLAARVTQRRDTQTKRLRERYCYQAPNTAANITVAAPDAAARRAWRAGVTAWRRLVGPGTEGLDYVTVAPAPTGEDRSYYQDGAKQVRLVERSGAGFHGAEAAVVHELTHWLEYRDDYINRQVITFYDRRTHGEPWRLLSEVTGNPAYTDDESTRVDRWIDVYMGKDYGPNRPRSHEVLTMAAQWLYAEPVQFAQKDPEMFAWTLDVLRRRLP